MKKTWGITLLALSLALAACSSGDAASPSESAATGSSPAGGLPPAVAASAGTAGDAAIKGSNGPATARPKPQLAPANFPAGTPASANAPKEPGAGTAADRNATDACAAVDGADSLDLEHALGNCLARTTDAPAKSLFTTSDGVSVYTEDTYEPSAVQAAWRSDGAAEVVVDNPDEEGLVKKTISRVSPNSPWTDTSANGRSVTFVGSTSPDFALGITECGDPTRQAHTDGSFTIHCANPSGSMTSLDLTFDARWNALMWRGQTSDGKTVERIFWDLGVPNTIEVPSAS